MDKGKRKAISAGEAEAAGLRESCDALVISHEGHIAGLRERLQDVTLTKLALYCVATAALRERLAAEANRKRAEAAESREEP